MAGPSNDEQYLLELINDARMDPRGDAARYIAGYAPLRSPAADIQSALGFFGVGGAALQNQFAALTPVQPVAWNAQLSSSAAGHNQAMIAADEQSHQLPGEADLGGRATAAGYSNWHQLGENVYAYSDDPLYAQAGFMVDWGSGPNGIQTPAGHRENEMSPLYHEVGVAIVAETDPTTAVGPEVVTEDFGAQFGTASFLLGVAYNDFNGDDFYEPGEGLGNLSVSFAGSTVTSWASGGYTLQTAVSGFDTVVFSGAGLPGAVSATINLATSSDVKFDVVSGDELKTSTSAVISGPIASVEVEGVQGLTLSFSDAANHALTGGAGGDSLLGGASADYIRGLDGDDTVGGGAGNDDVNGNKGDDSVSGGDGADWVRGGQGNDSVYGDAGDDVHVNGNLGDDVVHGGDGNDTVYGGQGNDTVYGDAGNDQISGDLGNDAMFGGAGADRFLFRPGFGQDWIEDFNSAEGDRVVLPAGTAYTIDTVQGQAVIDLGHGDLLGLAGVTPAQLGDWLVYG